MGIGLSERARSRLGECLRRLVQEQFQDGNLPSSLSSRHRNRLVQWCHGAAGFASLLSLASRCGIQCEGIESALEACGECLIARGFARGKGIGVCHGCVPLLVTLGKAIASMHVLMGAEQDCG